MTPSEQSNLGTPPVPAAPVATPPISERERIYAEHFNVAPPAAPPAVPEPVAVPVAAETVVPAEPPPLTTDQILASLVSEFSDLKKRFVQPPAAPAVPVPNASPQETADWLTLLSQGKRKEAEEAMGLMIAKQNSANEQALQGRVLAQVAAERDMQDFTQTIRSANADIVEMEGYIAPRVQNRLNEAMQAGRVQSPADYAQVYKELLTDEIKQARNFILRTRGAGAAQATTRQSEVVAAPALTPQQVNTQREQPTQSEPEVETPQAYLQRRQARSLAFKGLAT